LGEGSSFDARFPLFGSPPRQQQEKGFAICAAFIYVRPVDDRFSTSNLPRNAVWNEQKVSPLSGALRCSALLTPALRDFWIDLLTIDRGHLNLII
jgi:hypothetical protein